MQRQLIWFLFVLVLLATGMSGVSQSEELAKGVRYRNLSFPLDLTSDATDNDPGLRGEVCNDRNRMLDELFFTVHALTWDGTEKWAVPVYMDGVGPQQCRKFFKDVNHAQRVEKFSVTDAELNWATPLPADNLNTDLECRDLNIDRNNLQGTICNRTGQNEEDLFLKIFALGQVEQVLWTKLVAIGELKSRECKKFEQYLAFLAATPTEWAFLPVHLSSRVPFREGTLWPGLAYRIIRWDNGFLVGEFRCTQVPPFGYANMYALDANETIMTRVTVDLPKVTSKDWQPFAIYHSIRDLRPSAWRIAFSAGRSPD